MKFNKAGWSNDLLCALIASFFKAWFGSAIGLCSQLKSQIRNATMIRPVLFVDTSGRPRLGSSLLRTYQLQQLSEAILKRAGMRSGVTSSLAHRNSILILNKSTLNKIKTNQIAHLQSDNNILFADPLDGVIAPEVLGSCDVIIAASRTQYDALSKAMPCSQISYVGHHVDLRIDNIVPPIDRFRIGYFGEIKNAAFADSPALPVEFVPVVTARADRTDWTNKLSLFNAHYTLRNPNSPDGIKPFTKGFIAAHCGCPVLIGNDDYEARRHLPADYPFVTDVSSIRSINAAIDYMRNAFAGPDWRRANAAMEALKKNIAPHMVAGELAAAVAPYALTNPKRAVEWPKHSFVERIKQFFNR